MSTSTDRVIGRCSLCGGNVTVPTIWHGVNIPTPTCERCYAVEDSRLPEIKMVPSGIQRARP